MLWMVAWSLGSSYEVPQQQLWRRQHWLKVKCWRYREINSGCKLFDPTMLLCLLIYSTIFLSHYSGRKQPVLALCFSAEENGHYQLTALLCQNVVSPTQPTVILWGNTGSPSQQFNCGKACKTLGQVFYCGSTKASHSKESLWCFMGIQVVYQ